MDNYLLMGNILRCEVIPKDKVHPEIWVGANKRWKIVPKDRIERLKHDKVRRLGPVLISHCDGTDFLPLFSRELRKRWTRRRIG